MDSDTAQVDPNIVDPSLVIPAVPASGEGYIPFLSSEKSPVQEKTPLAETKGAQPTEEKTTETPTQDTLATLVTPAAPTHIVDARQEITTLHDLNVADADTQHADEVEEKFIHQVEEKNNATK